MTPLLKNNKRAYLLPFYMLLLLALAGSYQVRGQDDIAWKVTLNKKVVLENTLSGDTSSSVVRIKKAALNNNGVFKIDFTAKKRKGLEENWYRSIALFEAGETSIYQKDSTTELYIYNRDLLKLLWNRKKIFVYTWATPPDPGMAAVIRIKREKMFSIELED